MKKYFTFKLLPKALGTIGFYMLPILSALTFFTYNYVHTDELTKQFVLDFKNQNFDLLKKGDMLSLANRLNSLKSSGSWRCINASKDGVSFFSTDLKDCTGGLFNRTVSIEQQVPFNVNITLIYTPPTYVRLFFFGIVLLQFAVVLGMLFLQKQMNASKLKAFQFVFDVTRKAAHDIRSPLTSIQLIGSIGPGESTAESKEILNQSIKRLNLIASELLSEAKEFHQSFESVPEEKHYSAEQLGDLIKNVVVEQKLKTLNKDIKFSFIMSAGLDGKSFYFDLNEMERILLNITTNSLEAIGSASDGAIHLECVLNKCWFNHFCSIAITDNGKILDRALAKKLGSKVVVSQKKEGNGIGLYFISKTLKSWGGNLTVEPVAPRGAKVTILLRQSKS